MEFTMTAMLTIGSQPTPQSDRATTAPIHGFIYAEENDEGVNWHISEVFTSEGASWSCLLPDIAIVEGVLFAACYICDDKDADTALAMIADVVNGDVDYDETIGERAIAAASKVASKYNWTLTRWPSCGFFFSHLLAGLPLDTLYFLDHADA